MINMDYNKIEITATEAETIIKERFQINGKAKRLPGEIDFNFKIDDQNGKSFILKVSRPEENIDYLNFQQQLLEHLAHAKKSLIAPKVIKDIEGEGISEITDHHGNKRKVRLLTWISGRVWSSVNPKSNELLYSLGEECGKLTQELCDFDHSYANRKFEWDVAQSLWTENYLLYFGEKEREVLEYYQKRFKDLQGVYSQLRKTIVHNDANDNNVIVSEDLQNPKVISCIDYGDAVYTQSINDLAIASAYAIMNCNNPLQAILPIISGYHKSFKLEPEELKVLYVAIGMRLVISVTKSAINKIKEPENEYLLISEKPAWDLLHKWYDVSEDFAHYSFREACGYAPHPMASKFMDWTENQQLTIEALFPTEVSRIIYPIDLSVSSTFLGHEKDYEDQDYFEFKLNQIQKRNPGTLIAGGYMEPRPFYTSNMYEREGNLGIEYRTIHLGIDFWLPANTPVHAFMEGEVYSVTEDKGEKGYGGLVILKHRADDFEFFTIYGHLSIESIRHLKEGSIVNCGDLIGKLGAHNENGGWVPHLHFQVMLSMLDYKNDFPGVTFHSELPVWRSLCPDPNALFKRNGLNPQKEIPDHQIIAYRKQHLGKSLSLQYNIPIKMVRGKGQYLIDQFGKKYLDTVNNVAHVGHEHAQVVQAGQDQMGLINTNSRYLHENINELAREIIETLPPELSVLHFVNSGSEANELALRMMKAATGAKDVIASEVGYHGNSNACIDISSYKFDGKGGQGAPEHTHIFPLPDKFRGKFTGINTGPLYALEVKKLIDKVHKKGRNVGALIVEPIISCGGQIELPEGFLNQAYAYVREAGGVCISDEVQVGCGRVGKSFWGFQLYNVIPDIVTIGKPLGNGHPLAAVACTQEIAEKFANGMEYFNTFGGNPVSCAIGAAVLKVVKEEKLQQNALQVGEYLKQELRQLAHEFPIIGDVRGQGLFLGIEFVDKKLKPLKAQADYVINRMKDYGILMSTDGPDNNVLKIKPPMVFTETNASELIFYLRKVLKEDFMNAY